MLIQIVVYTKSLNPGAIYIDSVPGLVFATHALEFPWSVTFRSKYIRTMDCSLCAEWTNP